MRSLRRPLTASFPVLEISGAAFGYQLLWVAPVAMGLGLFVLSAAAHQTLSSGIRPYEAMRRFAGPGVAFAWAPTAEVDGLKTRGGLVELALPPGVHDGSGISDHSGHAADRAVLDREAWAVVGSGPVCGWWEVGGGGGVLVDE